MPLTPSWLKSLLEEHVEELQMLWELRLQAVRDPDYIADDLCEIDERIAAHLDALVLSQEHALPLLIECLTAGERAATFAAATAIISMQSPEGHAALWEAVDQVQGEGIDGYIDAFSCAKPELWESELQRRLVHPSHGVATIAATCLAFAGRLPPDYPRLSELLNDDDPTIRRRGWELVSLTSNLAKNA